MTSLDLAGKWEFLPEDRAHAELPATLPDTIAVPGLWEAQGYLGLDGAAWYRRRFGIDDPAGWWTLRFGAAMDTAAVYLNGTPVGAHDGAYTPFELPVTKALIAGENVLDVRVVDHPLDSPEHVRRAHGKQGWMNAVFPSPPSMYITYGGIWQPVRLRRHGPLAIADFHVSCDPGDLRAAVTVRNHTDAAIDGEVQVSLLDQVLTGAVAAPACGQAEVRFEVGAVHAARWTPADPVRHPASARVTVDGTESDSAALHFGLRTFAVEDGRFLLNGEPCYLRAALVQGFRPDVLYAEGTDEQIRREVLGAKDIGLNVLRLHIKAFDPRYLDVCDEVGMLVHCDIPVAEPVAHGELGDSGELAEAALRAVREQVRRDRSHPSIVLWSLMNEIGVERASARGTRGYEVFTRALYAAAAELDPDRPIIENDWIDPDPGRVFRSPVLTAHWYGRLSEQYLRGLAERVARHAGGPRPLYVSEFGDWGLPAAGPASASRWWAPGALFRALGMLPWDGPLDEFVAGTQRYQGVSDRLQGEVIRAGGSAGWCVTELTDVPQEYNGLWTLTRERKQSTADIARLCQDLLPVVRRRTWTVAAGEPVPVPLALCNEGRALDSAELAVTLDETVTRRSGIDVPAAAVTPVDGVSVRAPDAAGEYTLDVSLRGRDRAGALVTADNSYTVHVVARSTLDGVRVRVIGRRRVESALRSLGAQTVRADEPGLPVVVGEGALGRATGKQLRARLDAGDRVVVLAQPARAARHLPVPATAVALATEWGSTPFLFTTGDPVSGVLPRRRVLTTELLSVVPTAAWTDLDGHPWADQTLVGVYKPQPGEIAGTVLGRLRVGAGTLWLCQLALCGPAEAGDAAAAAILAAVVRDRV